MAEAKRCLVVWEKFSFFLDSWTPYDAAVSQLLNRAYSNNLTRAELADAEPTLSHFYVNFLDMQEFGPTGMVPVRRMLYEEMVPASVGYKWEFSMPHSNTWWNIPFRMQRWIEMAWMRGDHSMEVPMPDNQKPCCIDVKASLMYIQPLRHTFDIRRSFSAPYPIYKVIAKAPATRIDVPANLEGWGFASKPPEQQMDRMANQSQHKANPATGAHPEVPEVQALGGELEAVRSLTKRLSNFLLRKSSDAPARANTPQDHQLLQPPGQQQVKREVSSPSSAWSREPDFSGASDSSAQGSALGAVSKQRLLGSSRSTRDLRLAVSPTRGGELGAVSKQTLNESLRQVREARLVLEMIKKKAFDAGYLKEVQLVPIWMQPCPVCKVNMEWDIGDHPVSFSRCQHVVHSFCFLKLVQQQEQVASLNKSDFYFECPTCHVIYGKKMGCQPDGTMHWEIKKYHLPGHEDCKTIEITYNFQSSVQNALQPRPGKEYFAVGFPRRCFLPCNYHGQLILSYLTEAFQRRLLFTIGRSATTGKEDVVQPCVEHKTKVEAFPDPLFFQRCIQQLVNLGVAD